MIRPRFSRDEVFAALEQVAMSGIPGRNAARIIDIGSSQFIEYFQREVLDELVYRGGSTVRFFQGPYGAGKTHLLNLLRDQAMDDGLLVVETELSGTLNLEDWPAITKHILGHMQLRIDGDMHRSLPSILEAMGASRRFDVCAMDPVRVLHPGFKAAMKRYASSQPMRGRRLLRDYLMGERIGAGQLKDHGIRGVKNPLSSRNAESILRTVTSLLHAAGVPGTLLLFDENEQTFVVGNRVPRRVIVSANLMRRLIDACTTGSLVATAAVFAVLPGFLHRCSEVYPALGQRLHAGVAAGQAWRGPVLSVSNVNSASSPEAFLEACVDRYGELAAACGPVRPELKTLLVRHGRAVLETNASDGFRRPLMKSLASKTLEALERA